MKTESFDMGGHTPTTVSRAFAPAARDAAKKHHGGTDIKFDVGCTVQDCGTGAWVTARVWVSAQDIADEGHNP